MDRMADWETRITTAELARYMSMKTRTLERGAGHTWNSPDGAYWVDHAGCADREIQQLHSARKRGVYHRERERHYLRKFVASSTRRAA